MSSREIPATEKHWPGAAALVIGNELLTGKIREANVEVLARELFALGISFRRVVFCPDEPAAIAADLNQLRAGHDWVVTSGGVGPTHDDVTVEAVATAFGRPLVRSERLAGLLRDHFGERLNAEHLRMADIPAGSRLLDARGAGFEDSRWPLLLVDNVFVLPGLPEVFRHKMAILRAFLAGQPGARRWVSRAFAIEADEGEIAAPLRRVAETFPTVRIGSYPRGLGPAAEVTLTFDGLEESLVENAVAALHAALPDLILSAVPVRFPSPSGDR